MPRILFVLQDADGGVRETHRDLVSALDPQFESLVLSGSLHRVRLERWNSASGAFDLLHTWWLGRAWSQIRFRDPEHRRIYRRVLDRLAIDLVHVRHLLGHSLDVVDLCQERGLPLVLSIHDFYLACPSVHLLDDTGGYCGGQCTPTSGQCRLPIAWLDDLPVLKQGHLERWRRAVAELLPRIACTVTTSETARRVMTRAYPELRSADFRVIPHGRDFPPPASVAVEPTVGGPIRILVPGNLGYHKGADFVRRLLELDRRMSRRLELHLLGRAPAELAPLAICHGSYRRDQLGERAKAIAPSFAGIFSIWPETYCHTLTEAWSLGLPVLAGNVGTVRERLLEHGGGWLLPLDDVDRAYRLILEIADDPKAYREQKAKARVHGLPSVADMKQAYESIYRSLLTPASSNPDIDHLQEANLEIDPR